MINHQQRNRVVHPWPPVYDEHSRILILGTIPSPKSLEYGFYYGNPQNCFWRVLAGALDKAEPAPDKKSKTAFLLENRIALWDVLSSCDITGASDASISDPAANLFAPLLAKTMIKRIFTTGRAATDLFNRLCSAEAGMQAIYLPSTSPANRAAQSKPAFAVSWKQVACALTYVT
jgi:hypoxanthine-DNA glycosylase